MTNTQHMINSIIIIATFALIVVYAYIASTKNSRKARIRRWEKQRMAMQSKERSNKEALNTTSLYQEAENKNKIQKNHKWELHESI
jgi:hypothetical protein